MMTTMDDYDLGNIHTRHHIARMLTHYARNFPMIARRGYA
jgi:hypothetical protein